MDDAALHGDRLRRLREARATGRVPGELLDWLTELARASGPSPIVEESPVERVGLKVSEEIDRWMTRRGVTQRTISVGRSTLLRGLKGKNLQLSSVAEIADALDCDVFIEFTARPQVKPIRPQVDPCPMRSGRRQAL